MDISPPSPSFVLDQEVVLLFILNTSFLFHTFSFDSFILFLGPFKSLYKREDQKIFSPQITFNNMQVKHSILEFFVL